MVALFSIGGTAMADNAQDGTREWGPVKEGCRLSVTAKKTSFGYDQPIALRITLENGSDRTVVIVQSGILLDYEFDVRLPNDKPAPLTLEGKRQKDRPQFETVSERVKPNGTVVKEVPMLNRLYDMTLLGEYKVTVSRRVIEEGGKNSFVVKSNTLKVRVTEREIDEKSKTDAK